MLPTAPAWFRFRTGEAIHLGAFEPADAPDTGTWFDLGAQDVHALLGRGALRLDDLGARIRQGRPMPQPTAFCVPVPRPGKILCVARNYAQHAREFGAEPPAEPIFFAKLPDTLVAHGEPVVLPHWLTTRIDHEAELGLVLGFDDADRHGAKYIGTDEAARLVAGYTPINDVTARKLQGDDRDQKHPWLRSKSFDTFCPVGPFVVPADAIRGDDLELTMTVNGELRQRARTSAMLFPIGRVLFAMARCTTLRPGDLIATGTPAGVGPIADGDVMACTIEGLGTLQNPVVRERAR
jgi:5-oxopent-3-ene-1,2,5-tricarboxylate decarboxylase / 2-hydroxyhepta-2,4-diene-1,7-dioate isomerase